MEDKFYFYMFIQNVNGWDGNTYLQKLRAWFKFSLKWHFYFSSQSMQWCNFGISANTKILNSSLIDLCSFAYTYCNCFDIALWNALPLCILKSFNDNRDDGYTQFFCSPKYPWVKQAMKQRYFHLSNIPGYLFSSLQGF